MKKIYLLLLFVIGFSAFAQQKGISYQAVIINPKAIAAPGYNGTSIPLANKAICLSFQIVNSANQVEYQESQSITTDGYGMVNAVIGTGTSGTGLVTNLDAVNWGQGNKKLVVGVNTDGICSNYIEISNQALNYTPYSFYAQNADLKDGYVSTAKLADGAVTDSKVAMGINPSKVGLGNVNNTNDANKPVSTATQTALNLKANATDVTSALILKEDVNNKSSNISLDASSTTKYPTVKAIKDYIDTQNTTAGVADGTITSAKITNGTIVNADVAASAAIDFTKLNIQKSDVVGLGLNKSDIGLSNVDNTTDADKPVSSATQTALDVKANTSDVTTALALKANTTEMNAALALKANGANVASSLALKANTTDVNNALIAKADVIAVNNAVAALNALLVTKADNIAVTNQLGTKEDKLNKSVDVTVDGSLDTKYPSVKAVKTYVDAQVAGATIADASATEKGKIQLVGDLAGTAAAPTVPGLALKENLTNKSTDVTTDAASDTKYPSVKAVKTYVDAQVAGATIADASATEKGKIQLAGDLAGTAAAPTVPGLALKATIASPTFTGTVSTSALSSTSITAPTYASTPIALTYTGTNINWNPAQGLNAAITLTQNSGLNFTAAPPVGSYGTVVLTQDATGTRTITLPTLNGVTNKVLGSTSTTNVALSTAANSKDILNFYFDGTICYWNIGQGYGVAATAASSTANLASGVTGTLPVANGGTGATTASAALTSLGGAPLASPTFTGIVTAPIYASTPQLLTDGSTITWNPSLGLNASVTLGGNRTLSFSTTPVAGAYGTLVVTQDGIGSRTLTLPSTANKVLGSISTTSIALSTAAGAKDIINFYYDGTNCYWNIGQGYGSAAVSSTPNLTSGVTGTLAVTNGGTGAATLTGLVKGNGTGAMTAAVAGTDYQAPLTLTTTGTGAATLSGTTLNIPTPASGSSSAAVFLPTIVIGTQQWARLNLDVVTYRNGDIIPQVTDEATWNSLTTGAWCYYNNDPANAKYGKLYNWYAVNDPRGLAPTGWHIPTNAEWGILIDKLNSYPGVLTNKLKAVGADWQSNTFATNESGFTGLPGGTRSIGGFNRLGQIGMWWSSGTCAYAYMEYYSSNLSRSGSNSEFGISVRCVRD